jgi:hypothetical protein
MLDSTVESVNCALKRARANLPRRRPPAADREPPPPSDSPAEDAIVAKFVHAWESADIDALVTLLKKRRLYLNATDALRVRRPSPGSTLLHQPLPPRPEIPPRADTSQRSAGVLCVSARPYRHPQREPDSSSSPSVATASAP